MIILAQGRHLNTDSRESAPRRDLKEFLSKYQLAEDELQREW
jgi:hypothetical protein